MKNILIMRTKGTKTTLVLMLADPFAYCCACMCELYVRWYCIEGLNWNLLSTNVDTLHTHINSLICKRFFRTQYIKKTNIKNLIPKHDFILPFFGCGGAVVYIGFEIFDILYCFCIKQNHASFYRHSPHHNHITSHTMRTLLHSEKRERYSSLICMQPTAQHMQKIVCGRLFLVKR